MIGNIFAGIVVVALVAAGVWMWWMENGPSSRDDAKKEDTSVEDSAKKDSVKKESEKNNSAKNNPAKNKKE